MHLFNMVAHSGIGASNVLCEHLACFYFDSKVRLEIKVVNLVEIKA